MRLRFALATIGLALLTLPALAQKDFPYGWHKPRKAELGKRASKDLALRADFDGDGKPDTAVILADDRGRAVGVFAFLTSTSRWVKLDSEAVAELPHWHIKLAAPGTYQTTCLEGETGCRPGPLKLERAAIESYREGKSHSLFYWDAEAQEFKQAQVAR